MMRFFAVAALSFALVGIGCSNEKKKDDTTSTTSSSTAGGGTTATAKPCTKCKCPNWSDANGDAKCDTLVDGKPCDHTAADHGSK